MMIIEQDPRLKYDNRFSRYSIIYKYSVVEDD
jgi:hypothetical protein